MKWRCARNSHLGAKHTLQYRKWKTQTDEKSLNSLKPRPTTRAGKSLVCCVQDEKYRRVIVDIIPCVVVTSLETDVAIVAYFDMLTVRSNLSARSRKEGTQGAVAILRKKSKVVYLKTQIRWILCYGKLKNWDWTLLRDTPEILRMHLVQIWTRERKWQSGGIIQKGEPHERNPCAPGSEEQPPEENLMTSRLWQQSSVELGENICKLKPNIKLRFILLWRRQKHRRSNVYGVFGRFNAQCWARRIELRYNGYFEKVQETHKRHTATGEQCK